MKFHLPLCLALLSLWTASPRAEFIPTGAGPYDYDTPTNWVGSAIDGVFSNTLTASQAVTFDSNYVLSTGLTFQFGGGFDLTLRGDGTNRSITLGGDILVDTARTAILGGSSNQNLNIDYGAHDVDIRRGALRALNGSIGGTGAVYLGGNDPDSANTASFLFGQSVSSSRAITVRSTNEIGATRTLGIITGTGATQSGNITIGDGSGSISHLVLNVAPGNSSLTVSGTLSNGTDSVGAVTVRAATGSDIRLQGANSNTYTGATRVENGTLILNKSGGAVAIQGDLHLGGGVSPTANPSVRLDLSNQFNLSAGVSTSVVYFDGSSAHPASFRMNVNSTAQNIAGLHSTSAGNAYVEALTSGTAGNYTITLSGDGTYDFSGMIRDGDGATSRKVHITKTGDGIQTFSGEGDFATNTYTGNTTVNAGILIVNKSHVGAGAYHVKESATLAGDGSITTANADVVIESGAILSAGYQSAGTFTFSLGTGQFVLEDNVVLPFLLGTEGDRISLQSGQLVIGSGLLEFSEFDFSTGAGFAPGTYTLFETSAAISGSLGNDTSGMVGGFLSTLEIEGTNLVLNVVPEASGLHLLLLSLAGLLPFMAGRIRLPGRG